MTNPISSFDPNVIALLTEKLEKLQKLQDLMKSANNGEYATKYVIERLQAMSATV